VRQPTTLEAIVPTALHQPTSPAPQTFSRAAVADIANDLRLACMRISRRVRFESTDEIAPHQFGVLAQLAKAPRTPRELAEHEKVSAPSMTRTVNGLVARGLVARADDPADGRQVILSLTPAGRALHREVRRKRDQWMVVRVKRLTPAEQEILRQASVILTKVASE
jgi:DNA-binding MarR family transcriptional regulator